MLSYFLRSFSICFCLTSLLIFLFFSCSFLGAMRELRKDAQFLHMQKDIKYVSFTI